MTFYRGLNDAFLEVLKNGKMIEAQCSNGFFVEKYKNSLMRRMNELPYDLEEIKKWFHDVDNWKVIKKKLLKQLWYPEENIKSISNQPFSQELYTQIQLKKGTS